MFLSTVMVYQEVVDLTDSVISSRSATGETADQPAVD
jgi:hypothetical protein